MCPLAYPRAKGLSCLFSLFPATTGDCLLLSQFEDLPSFGENGLGVEYSTKMNVKEVGCGSIWTYLFWVMIRLCGALS